MILRAAQTHLAGRVFETPGLLHAAEFSYITLHCEIPRIFHIQLKLMIHGILIYTILWIPRFSIASALIKVKVDHRK